MFTELVHKMNHINIPFSILILLLSHLSYSNVISLQLQVLFKEAVEIKNIAVPAG